MAVINKVSEITTDYLAQYLRIVEPTDDQKNELATMLSAAKGYVSSYTGLPLTGDGESLDSHPEIVMAVCVLVQNHYDNRTLYTDKGKVEEVVSSILAMHRRNLL